MVIDRTPQDFHLDFNLSCRRQPGQNFFRLASYSHRLPGNDVAAALAPATGLGWGWVQAVQASQQMQAAVFHQLDQGTHST